MCILLARAWKKLIVLQANADVADGHLPPKEEQQKLLQDVRAKRDIFAQEKARVENLLNSAREKVKLYQAMLGTTESKLCSVEDLIGNIRFRLQQRGASIRSITIASPLPAPSETAMGAENLEDDHSSGMYTYSAFTFLAFH